MIRLYLNSFIFILLFHDHLLLLTTLLSWFFNLKFYLLFGFFISSLSFYVDNLNFSRLFLADLLLNLFRWW